MQKIKLSLRVLKLSTNIGVLVVILLVMSLWLSIANANTQEAEATYKNTQEYKDYEQAKAELEEAINVAKQYDNGATYQTLKQKQKSYKQAEKAYKKTKEYKAFIKKQFVRLEGGYGSNNSSDSFISYNFASSLFGGSENQDKSTKNSLYYANIEFGSLTNNNVVKPHYYGGISYLQSIKTKDNFQAQYITTHFGLDLYIGKKLSAVIGANMGFVYANRTKLGSTSKTTGVGYTFVGKLGVALALSNRIGLELGTKLGYIYLPYDSKNGGSYNFSGIAGSSNASYISGYGAIKFLF